MKTKQEQIEETAKIIANTWLVDLDGDTKDVCEVLDEADIQCIARELYGKGCRIIPDDAVVLTKEECDNKVILNEDHFERALNYEREKARKETAKQSCNDLIKIIKNNTNLNASVFGWTTESILNMIKTYFKEKFDVEVEE